ncbi:hypothetical protein [Nocardioides daejeonensis]|uniref:hypothetical protein n=1 Tax=Nocardioides daejeonensis TaxID=1046556 RepID=UPI001951F5A7|nr:hypothetical protein [Nocardioides daejeonensis]
MSKLVFVLLAPSDPDHVVEVALSGSLRERLAAAGADRVQVNVIDEAFTGAMNFQVLPEPIVGLVSVWYGGARHTEVAATLVDALSGAGVRHHGWAVEEREPLVAPDASDGERVPAMANLAFLRRPADLPYEEWRTIWQESHTQVAIDTQATFGYVQNRVLEPLTPGTPAIAAIVEELFPEGAATDPHLFYGSGGDAAELNRRLGLMLESVARFGAAENLDLVSTARRRWRLAARD